MSIDKQIILKPALKILATLVVIFICMYGYTGISLDTKSVEIFLGVYIVVLFIRMLLGTTFIDKNFIPPLSIMILWGGHGH